MGHAVHYYGETESFQWQLELLHLQALRAVATIETVLNRR